MQPEPERWWEYAERDLGPAQAILDMKRWDAASLFAQQAVEKALKALLARAGGRPPRIHDLVIPPCRLERVAS
jgi:HEPN domain-containing protein